VNYISLSNNYITPALSIPSNFAAQIKYTIMDDKKFIADLIARCPIAWRGFDKLYFVKIGNRILFLVPNPFFTNELRQKVLIRVMKGLPKFNSNSVLWTWIYRIITNVCITHLRAQAANDEIMVSIDQCERSNSEYQHANGDGHYDNQDQLFNESEANQMSDKSNPEKILERKESQAQVDITTGILKGNQATVFDLHYNKGYSFIEIGLLLCISAEAAWKLYDRALKKMRKFLFPDEEE
jgi:RNA polymerase sigma factor (sigma-70 family)